MYESFFGLKGRPFQLNPDPRFFFRSTGHKRALAYMRYGLQQEQGFIVVTGDVGTGKTMLVNSLFREIEGQGVVAAKIVSSNVKDVDLLRLRAAEFEMPFERISKASLLHNLEEYFKACRDEGKRVLLVVDEAQNLPRSALEELRMLSNFDYGGVPLVQSFLLGQREFRGVLRAPGLEQLRQRVIAAYHLKPLSAEEVKSYIEHRMRKVGWEGDPSIEDAVYERVFTATGGVPRRINTLFDRMLLNCHLDESHALTFEIADTVCREIAGEQGTDDTEEDSWQEEDAISDNRKTGGPSPREQQLEEQVARLESRLKTMQSTIEELTAMSRPSSPRDAMPVSVDHGDMSMQFSRKGFPYWTAAVISVLVVVAIVGISVGVWMSRN